MLSRANLGILEFHLKNEELRGAPSDCQGTLTIIYLSGSSFRVLGIDLDCSLAWLIIMIY
jgi:hypothetical protein